MIVSKTSLRATTASTVLIAVLAFPASLAAQEVAPNDGGPQADGNDGGNVIVVTALKRGDLDLVDAAAGISVIRGDDIEDLGADSLNDFLQLAPGTSIDVPTASGQTNIQIRGVNSNYGSATVGFYLDDLPFSAITSNVLPDPSPFDLAAVEILRGPQGTLYGGGASGGVVVVRTNDPVLDRFEGKADFSLSTTDEGGENYALKGALNVPLIEGVLGFRGAISYVDDSGWVDDPSGTPSNKNDHESFNARGKLLFEPTPELSIKLLGAVSRVDAGAIAPISDDSGEFPFAFLIDDFAETDYEQYGAVIQYDFDGFSIKNATGLIDWRSQFTAPFVFPVLSSINVKSFTNELRLFSDNDGPLSWVVGGYYRDTEQTIIEDASALSLFVLEGAESEQFAIYADANLELADGFLEIGAGVSYFKDDTVTTAGGAPSGETDTERFSPQATISIHPTEDSTIYARYAEGYRPSVLDFGLNIQLIQLVIPGFDGVVQTEDITAYEAGIKHKFGNSGVYAELIFFRNEIEDIQQSTAVIQPGLPQPVNSVINAGNATAQGIEFLLSANPNDNLSLLVAGAYTDAEVDEDFFDTNFSTVVPIYSEGDPLNRVPEFTISANAAYTVELGNDGLAATFSASVQHATKRALVVLAAPPIFGDDVTRVDLRAEVGKDNWSAYLFAENLFNEDGVISPSAFSQQLPLFGIPFDGQLGSRYRPRTVGAGVRFSF